MALKILFIFGDQKDMNNHQSPSNVIISSPTDLNVIVFI